VYEYDENPKAESNQANNEYELPTLSNGQYLDWKELEPFYNTIESTLFYGQVVPEKRRSSGQKKLPSSPVTRRSTTSIDKENPEGTTF
jgi:hypothetical protein